MDWQSGSNHMIMRTNTNRRSWLLGFVALSALITAACGTDVSQSTAERASAPVQAGAPPVEYGASLEEFGDAVQQSEQPAAQQPATQQPESGHSLGTTIGTPTDSGNSEYPSIAWDDLIPPGFSGREIFARYEERLDEVEIGSSEAAALYEEMQAEFDPEAVNSTLDGQKIRLAGFIAPLTYDDDIVTEFLLVPNFGACIHVPPPPPNQTVMVTVDRDDGLSVEDSWGAVWVEGTLTVDAATTDLAAASYTITNAKSGVYTDF